MEKRVEVPSELYDEIVDPRAREERNTYFLGLLRRMKVSSLPRMESGRAVLVKAEGHKWVPLLVDVAAPNFNVTEHSVSYDSNHTNHRIVVQTRHLCGGSNWTVYRRGCPPNASALGPAAVVRHTVNRSNLDVTVVVEFSLAWNAESHCLCWGSTRGATVQGAQLFHEAARDCVRSATAEPHINIRNQDSLWNRSVCGCEFGG